MTVQGTAVVKCTYNAIVNLTALSDNEYVFKSPSQQTVN